VTRVAVFQVRLRNSRPCRPCAAGLQDSHDICTIRELPGHKDVRTTMLYALGLNRGGHGVRSPMDGLAGEGQSAFCEPPGSV